MNLRLGCNWVREQLLARKVHVLGVGPDQAAKEDDLWEAAVAEIDGWLDPDSVEVDEVDVWSDPEWIAAMGGEMAGVS